MVFVVWKKWPQSFETVPLNLFHIWQILSRRLWKDLSKTVEKIFKVIGNVIEKSWKLCESSCHNVSNVVCWQAFFSEKGGRGLHGAFEKGKISLCFSKQEGHDGSTWLEGIKRVTQGTFLQNYLKIGLTLSEEKIF